MIRGAGMKAGWQQKELGRLAELKGRIGWRGLTAKEYTESGPLFLSVHSLNYGTYVDFRDAFHISEQRYDESPEIMVQKDDVLICKDGAGIGKVGIVGDLPGRTTINSSLLLIRSGKYSLPKFLYYCLSSPYFQAIVNSRLNGATTPHLYQRDITEFPVFLPPLPEQKRIVGILDEAFDGIATAKANTEKNLQNARALFESHLQATFTQGSAPAVPLSSLLSMQPRNGWSPPAEYQTGTGTPVLTLSSVTGFEYDGSRIKLTSAPTRDGAHYWLEKGELLITRSNTRELVGHVAIYDGAPPKAICCDLIMKMRVNPAKALTRFVYFYLRSPDARSYLTSRAQGASSTMKKIGKAVVQNIPIPIPSLAEQKSTAVKLDTLLGETQRLNPTTARKSPHSTR